MRGSLRLRKQRVVSESESDNEAPKNKRASYPKRKSRKLPKYETSDEEEENSNNAVKPQSNSDSLSKRASYPKRKSRKLPKYETSDEEEENSNNAVKPQSNSDSSSESDIENYLKHPSEMDFESSYFQVHQAPKKSEFENIESNILEDVNMERLSDSDSDEKMEPVPTQVNFQTLHKYTKDMDEAKKVIQKYEASKKKAKTKENIVNENEISNLLALGETKRPSDVMQHSDSFSDSEKEDWEEIEHNEVEEDETTVVRKEGLEVVVQLPGGGVKKKKEVDMLASIKRRLNRVRKENQVLVHKVHLLCWLAHGNYVNKTLNNENLMALALSLIPSQHSYPPERTDLNYLEKIVKWYRDLIQVVEKKNPPNVTLEELLKSQITSKTAYSKQMLIYIFVCILRSLGIQCRIVLSFQVEPLRPPASDLHSLSTKIEDEQVKATTASSSKKQETVSPTKKDDEKPGPSKVSLPKRQEKAVKKPVLKKEAEKAGSTKNQKASSTRKSLPEKQEKEIPYTYDIAEKDKLITKKILDRQQAEQDKRNNVEKESKPKTSRKSQRVSVAPTTPSKRGESKPGTSRTRSKKTETQKETSKLEPKSKTIVAKKSLLSSKSPSLARLRLRSSVKISQVDGVNDSDDESESMKKSKKPNLKGLSQKQTSSCPVKKHEKRLQSGRTCKSLPKKQSSVEESSGEDFELVREKKQPNLKNLKNKPSSSVSTKGTKRQPLPSGSKQLDVRDDIVFIMKSQISKEKGVQKTKLAKSRRSRKSSGEDSDYVPVEIQKKAIDSDDEFHEKTKIKVKQRVKTKKMLEQEAVEVKKKKGIDVWVEVFLESEEKWITADLIKGKVHCVSEIYSRASHPVSYIVAWNNDNSIKDVTQRYCVNWNTVTRKLRVDPKWWEKSLQPFVARKTARDREEDEELARLQLEKPLPTAISEYKNHPLYALERHLLKYEAFYPPNPTILGFIRKEPVYSRDCVFTLHSRESWFKYAKVVKPGEQAYKIVLRPKWDKINRKILKNQPLDAFGEWQVQQYVPPPAENGIVPKNEYGNVDLFQKSMLPKGTVHLQLPALNKVARRMNIDCPPAMVGFDVHHGWTHPVFDGFVVCEEHAEPLIAAWHLEQEEIEKREKEKVEKRVYDNWKKLIKGLWIRERLEARYKFGESSNSAPDGLKRKPPTSKFTKSKRQRKGSESEKDK